MFVFWRPYWPPSCKVNSPKLLQLLKFNSTIDSVLYFRLQVTYELISLRNTYSLCTNKLRRRGQRGVIHDTLHSKTSSHNMPFSWLWSQNMSLVLSCKYMERQIIAAYSCSTISIQTPLG